MPLRSLEELEQLRMAIQASRDPRRARLALCCSGCTTSCAQHVAVAFEAEIRRRGLEGEVDVVRTGCAGPCNRGPAVMVFPARTLFQKVRPADVPAILSQTLTRKEVSEPGYGTAFVSWRAGGFPAGDSGPARFL